MCGDSVTEQDYEVNRVLATKKMSRSGFKNVISTSSRSVKHPIYHVGRRLYSKLKCQQFFLIYIYIYTNEVKKKDS